MQGKKQKMIKPSTLWALFKSCDDSKWLGDLCRSLGKQEVELDYGQKQMVAVIKSESGWMDERVEAQRERWRERQRQHRDNGDNCDNGDKSQMSPVTESHVTNHPTNLPTIQPSNKESNNRSVNVPLGGGTERNANGTVAMPLIPAGASEAHRMAAEFAMVVNRNGSDGGEAFFDGRFDAVTICVALTGDFKSARRWRQIVNAKGEGAVREEAFTFWREIQSGEDADNRGAALNARLGKLKDKTN